MQSPFPAPFYAVKAAERCVTCSYRLRFIRGRGEYDTRLLFESSLLLKALKVSAKERL